MVLWYCGNSDYLRWLWYIIWKLKIVILLKDIFTTNICCIFYCFYLSFLEILVFKPSIEFTIAPHFLSFAVCIQGKPINRTKNWQTTTTWSSFVFFLVFVEPYIWVWCCQEKFCLFRTAAVMLYLTKLLFQQAILTLYCAVGDWLLIKGKYSKTYFHLGK